jgi:hypothetical protein
MGYCGFPVGAELRQTSRCTLYPEWSSQNGTLVPDNAQAAVCRTFPAGVDCPE